MAEKFFHLFAPRRLGDYWRIAISGISGEFERRDGRLRYARVGSFVPPLTVTLAGDVIVPAVQKELLTAVTGVKDFVPVIKECIVRLEWTEVEFGRDEFMHEFGEPEDVVTSGGHDEILSRNIGELFEVILENDGAIDTRYDHSGKRLATFIEPPHRGLELFNSTTIGGSNRLVASERFIEKYDKQLLMWLDRLIVDMP